MILMAFVGYSWAKANVVVAALNRASAAHPSFRHQPFVAFMRRTPLNRPAHRIA